MARTEIAHAFALRTTRLRAALAPGARPLQPPRERPWRAFTICGRERRSLCSTKFLKGRRSERPVWRTGGAAPTGDDGLRR
jgi:hypothetical protein